MRLDELDSREMKPYVITVTAHNNMEVGKHRVQLYYCTLRSLTYIFHEISVTQKFKLHRYFVNIEDLTET